MNMISIGKTETSGRVINPFWHEESEKLRPYNPDSNNFNKKKTVLIRRRIRREKNVRGQNCEKIRKARIGYQIEQNCNYNLDIVLVFRNF